MRIILKKIAGWTAFLVVTVLLLASPELYVKWHSGSWSERAAVCGQESPHARDATLREVSTHADYWNGQQVSLLGNLSYLKAEGIFYFRDGIFSAPLDISGCQHVNDFKNEEIPVSIKGTVVDNNGLPLIEVTDLREIVPGFVQMLFDAGFLLMLALFCFAVVGLAKSFIWAVRRLGLVIKPRPPLSQDERKSKAAVSLLTAAILAPLVWFLVPAAGAVYHVIALAANWKGLRSKRKRTSIAGLAMCVIGFLGMALVSLANGSFEKPVFNPYPTMFLDQRVKPLGTERLELKPYVNKTFYFSIHLPKGWTADENGQKDMPGFPLFKGPEWGTFQGKPFVPQLVTLLLPAESANIQTLDDAVKQILGSSDTNTSTKFIANDHRLLAGGRLDTVLIEATFAKDGADMHQLLLVALKNGVVYMVATKDMPEEKWGAYDRAVRDALDTLEIFPDDFASCLKMNGAVLYGSEMNNYWENTDAQKELFGNGASNLRFVECLTRDSQTVLPVCKEKSIAVYATWEFADGSRLAGVQDFKTLAGKTGCPVPQGQ